MHLPETWRWSGEISEPGKAVVFDIDGVLANADERQYLINGENCDWPGFFAACSKDTVIEESARLLELIGKDTTIILLTGRPVQVEDETIEWLQSNGLRWDLLIMRERGTYDSSLEFKHDAVRLLKRGGYLLRLAFEDDQRNREMFQNEDVPCMYIHSGYYAARDAANV